MSRRKKIVFLLHNAYAIGGTVRTTLNLASALADHHDVEIASMARHLDEPRFTVDPRVRLVPLVDIRPYSPDLRDPAQAQPATDYPAEDKRHRQYSRLTDLRVRAYLAGCDADVVIGTRPGINVYVSRFAPRRALRIAQEHLRHDAHTKQLRKVLARHYRTLDAVVTTTAADAAVYRARMKLPGVRVMSVPNIVPEATVAPSDGTAPVIAAAGRLARGKRFDLLLEAFAKIAPKEPDWQLRIYGGGKQQGRLETLIQDLGLTDRAHLMGPHTPIEEEFARASLVVSASDAESFGMTLVEAMRCGVPVVSTDCPLGPAEIITDGVDGRLVPVDDPHALADALLDLTADPSLRRAMGRAALASAHRYDPAPIVSKYEHLFAELHETKLQRTWERSSTRAKGWLRRRVRAWKTATPAPFRGAGNCASNHKQPAA
ncbi:MULTISPECIES: glycosyltransferase family 4 protein [unclassified Streptomyces]|uniref:glycosyltransferase family 4 protein n=1 Tax=unclassified Streptomyces TaxID=2593676 RepID=UPI002E765A99|nr:MULTISPECIES: glycosyltransferase family 4 protein [unclassified Streptomyces]MEE1758468.1 glycosyltransferase family 4 protein [Streptomyces sp. SP18BB07]MEE1830088.1 glycosyltransferase family 4 protein [Streptomyces sp. SP17KL33]